MSVQALSFALYQTSGLTPAAKLILVTIADHCNVETGWAWPSTARLAALTGVGKRQVIRHLEALESAGLLHVQKRAGRPSGYRIITRNQAPDTPESGDTHVTTPAQTGDTHVTTPVTPTSPPTGDTHVTSTNEPVTSETKSGDTHVTRTVKNRREEDEEERGDPAGSAARIADRVALVTEVIPDTWAGVAVVCDDPRLDILDELTDAGWTSRQLRAACATLPKAHSNPTGLLVRHLNHYRGRHPDVIAHSRTPSTPTPPAANAPECAHGAPVGAWCHDCEQEASPW